MNQGTNIRVLSRRSCDFLNEWAGRNRFTVEEGRMKERRKRTRASDLYSNDPNIGPKFNNMSKENIVAWHLRICRGFEDNIHT